ncbi:hypothetical protein DFH09DRAFT_1220227, partial [Mycena vulgaris]
MRAEILISPVSSVLTLLTFITGIFSLFDDPNLCRYRFDHVRMTFISTSTTLKANLVPNACKFSTWRFNRSVSTSTCLHLRL